MSDFNIEDYAYKKIRVVCHDGIEIVGRLYGYNYDYDNDGNEFMEIDIERLPDKALIGVTDREIDGIDIIG